MPTLIAVHCPHCHRDRVVKRGKTARGTQRSLCQNQACVTDSLLLDYRHRGCLPDVKELISDMRLNASGVRDTARSLPISTDTVLRALKKTEPRRESVNTAVLKTLHPEEVTVALERAGAAEMDDMWSFVRCKSKPRWLWHAMDHHTGAVLAYVFGRRKDEAFCSSRRCWTLSASPSTTQIRGARTRVLSTRNSTWRASAIHRKSSAST